MEFDNDRRIHPPYKTEIIFWIAFMLLGPLVNAITYFWFNSIFFVALLFMNVMAFPLYILYGRIIAPRLLFQKKPFTFSLVSIAFFFFMLFFATCLNALLSSFSLTTQEYFYL